MNETPIRKVYSGPEARQLLIQGVSELAKTVASTMGASGKTVILETPMGTPYITKDGVTVAEYINPLHPVSNQGASLVREASKKTAQEAGDGTTTSTVLAEAILLNALDHIDDSNFRTIIKGLEDGLDKVIAEIDSRSTEVTKDNLKDIATISANGDVELGEIIAEAYETVGLDGSVLIGSSDSPKTYIDIQDGSSLRGGLASAHFSNAARGKAEFKKSLILITDQVIDNIWKIQTILEECLKTGNSLIIVGELEPQALATLAVNKRQAGMKVAVVNPPLFGTNRQQLLDDLALLTSANIIGEEYGNALDNVTSADLGTVKFASIDNDATTFKFEKPSELVEERVKSLKEQLEVATKEERGILKMRLNLISGKVATIKVGAVTNTEHKELVDRVDDSIHATRCALQEGVLPGGGSTFKDIAMKLSPTHNLGEQILYNSLTSPISNICHNAGLKVEDFEGFSEEGKGVDVSKATLVDMKEAGIIDPTKVTKHALINALSVAKNILTTDHIVVNLRQGDV